MTRTATADPGPRGIFFGKRFMRRVPVGLKLWSTTAILALPLMGLCVFYVHTLKATLWFTSAESTGYTMIRPLDEIARRVTAREVLVVHSLVRKDGATADVKRLDDELDARLKALAAVEAAVGNAATHGETETLRTHWRALQAAPPGTPQDSLAAHEHLMDDVAALMNQVGSDWNLTLDPELSTYNLIDVTLTKLPDARHFIAQTRAQLAMVFAGGRYQPRAAARSLSLLSLVDDRLGAARDEVKTAAGGAAADPLLAASINEKSKDWDAGIGAWSADLVGELSSAAPDETRVRALLQASDGWAERLNATQDAMLTVSAGALEVRHAEQARSAIIALVGSAIAMVAGIVLMLALAKRISGAITRLLAISEAISQGRYDSYIDEAGHDEISRLFAGIKTMQNTLAEQQQMLARQQESLAAQMDAERAQSVENGRIRSALDNVAGCVMVADAGASVIYSNPAIDALLRDAEGDIRRVLPEFSAARIRGMDLKTLHETARRQSGSAPDLSVPHSLPLECGGRTFRLTVNPVVSAQGERLGTVVEWVDRTVELAMERETQAMLEGVLAGNLAQRIDVSGKTGFFEILGRGMNRLTDNVQDIITKVQRAALEVHNAASEISAGNTNLSSRTEQQAASLEETASSMEQITATVKQNSDNAHQASQLSAAAREQAQTGGAVVSQAIAAMAEINESSGKIANIIGVIDEIAFQTNLLALNAAVEAARAGTQGRGFAVVASEVRSLASRSAAAAKEIKDLIRDSVGKVEGGTRLVTQSGQTLEQIVIAVKKVTDVVAEIASASSEQTTGIEQVNIAITQMDEMTQQNAALVEQATAASQAMAQQAGDLTAMLAGYHTGEAPAGAAAVAGGRPRRWAKTG